MAYQNCVEGIAVGLIIADRHDLLHMDEEVEKAGMVLLAGELAKGEEPPNTSEV
jgi:hypothetical protein